MPVVIIAGVAAVIACSAAAGVESIWKRRARVIEAKHTGKAKIIEAKSVAEARIIEARAEAEALMERTKSRSALELRTEQTAEILRLRATDVDLPAGRRPTDDTVVKILTAKPKNEHPKPAGPPNDAPRVLRSVPPKPPPNQTAG